MGDWVFGHPAIPMSIVAGLAFALLVAGGIVVGNRFLDPLLHGRDSSNHIIETTLTVFSAFYGILLGLLAVGAYENINAIGDVVSNEASAISVLHWNFQALPDPPRGELLAGLRTYAREVVDHSFDEQARGQRPTAEIRSLHTVFDTLTAFEPKTTREQSLQAQAMRELSDLEDARNARLNNFDIRIPDVLWWIVALGALITLLLICLLDFPLRIHLVFGCLLAFFIGAMIYVIAAMDNPFSGADRVEPQAIQELLDAVSPPR